MHFQIVRKDLTAKLADLEALEQARQGSRRLDFTSTFGCYSASLICIPVYSRPRILLESRVAVWGGQREYK